MLAHVKSDIGKVREINEDSYAFHPPNFFGVADGMGGHAAGEVASSLAIKAFTEFIEKQAGSMPIEQLMEEAICQANTLIYEMSLRQTEYLGMGTTVTAAYIEGNHVYWSHVGDSRLYLIQDNSICQLTNDHSLVWELFLNGSITQEEIQSHPQRNMLTRAVGTSQTIAVECGSMEWGPGDILLLCTDGLTSMLNDQEIYQSIRTNLSRLTGEQVLEELVNQANRSGGLDNITAILLQYGD
ncbi:hypothetical protein P22_0285 [Propionispora sp. 2/2-37]|uniref:Stp1/IreP family PP2C-type Ser/Thr phosphatase n=1 Tax=Propionispora sp. 2/2-37 TaxID=1677858 RepID=UPI0006BB6CD3|nr:Stp1/IreP family PP2C-type Ser/Thr phosphatase [Propionispora sp. 2/2-37]CUH94219.1 hypothetical protein P22_0285 [Propionispora sp. 2/2-37]